MINSSGVSPCANPNKIQFKGSFHQKVCHPILNGVSMKPNSPLIKLSHKQTNQGLIALLQAVLEKKFQISHIFGMPVFFHENGHERVILHADSSIMYEIDCHVSDGTFSRTCVPNPAKKSIEKALKKSSKKKKYYETVTLHPKNRAVKPKAYPPAPKFNINEANLVQPPESVLEQLVLAFRNLRSKL